MIFLTIYFIWQLCVIFEVESADFCFSKIFSAKNENFTTVSQLAFKSWRDRTKSRRKKVVIFADLYSRPAQGLKRALVILRLFCPHALKKRGKSKNKENFESFVLTRAFTCNAVHYRCRSSRCLLKDLF